MGIFFPIVEGVGQDQGSGDPALREQSAYLEIDALDRIGIPLGQGLWGA